VGGTPAPPCDQAKDRLPRSQRWFNSTVGSEDSSCEVAAVAKQRMQIESQEPSGFFLCENDWSGE
jgi:hypothetical protein